MTDLDLTQLDPANLTRTIIDLNAQRLAQIDPALPDLMRACAIPVAFNVEIVSQLVSLSACQLDAATALSHILTLPFIIQRQDGDYTYHDNSRNLMLADWQNDRPRYLEYVSRLVVYYAEQGEITYQQENYQATLTWINRALELTENQPELANLRGRLYNGRGHAQFNLGNYTESVHGFTLAIKYQAANANSYSNLGISYYYLNNTQDALTAFSEAIRLNPQDTNAFYNRGFLYQNSGQTDLALADYNKAISFNPQDVEAFHNRGLIYQNLGQTDLALANYNEAIHHNPQLFKTWHNRGNIYIQQKLFDLAIKSYDQAIQINPQYALAYYNRACAWALQGQVEAALHDLRQAFALDKAQGSTEHVTAAQTDSDLDSLRELPAFQALLAEFGGSSTAD